MDTAERAGDDRTRAGRHAGMGTGPAWSFGLSAAAVWLALGGFWVKHSTYERYRGRTDLDMPEWFAINVDLTLKVVPLALLGGFLDLIAACGFLTWAGRTGWAPRVAFVLQWGASVTILFLLMWSRIT